jgi:protoporphyrinogen oxidase
MKTIIIGGGISGLACAYHLEKRKYEHYVLFEAAGKIGGLCGSYTQNGFVFDYSGHLLHVSTKRGLKLVEKLLGKNIAAHKRRAYVFINNTELPFPFQNNLYGLPDSMISQCVNGALKAYKDKSYKPGGSFKKRALALYGKPICDYFMFPYNEKLWQFDLSELTDLWCDKFMPSSTLEDIIKGAYCARKKDFGYNSTFFYPKTGGARAICNALASDVSNIKLNCEIKSVNLKNRTALANGAEIKYESLVSTIPLNKLGQITSGLPDGIKKRFEDLRHNSVRVLNIGAQGKTKDGHWYYFPEREFPFYRIGIQSSFSANAAPRGASSFYVETPDIEIDEKLIISQMRGLGFIEKNAKILAKNSFSIPIAYPIYDKKYQETQAEIVDYFTKQNIYPLGRYGKWEYSFMEKSLLDGEAVAEILTAGENK